MSMLSTLTRSLGILTLAFAVVTVLPSTVAAAEEDVPTFTKDVAPIFQAKCEACHRAGSIAPMSLVTFQESRPWARSIRERVSTRQMPPWHLDRTVGITEFKNDRSLTQDQIDTVVAWVDGGSPMGNAADMPAPVEWPTSPSGTSRSCLVGRPTSSSSRPRTRWGPRPTTPGGNHLLRPV